MLKIALAGYGIHGRHAVQPALVNSSRIELAALCDPRPEAFDGVDVGTATTYHDYAEMLSAGGFDAVYIATIENLHLPMALDAFRAGYHVLCEKPLAMNSGECRQMLEASRSEGKVLAVGFEKRYHHDQQQVHEWIRQGQIGRVEGIHYQEFWDGHKTFGPLSGRRANHIDLSSCLDCGIHCLDLARFHAGGGAWQRIHAIGRWFGENERKHAVHISVLADLDTGPMVTLNSSFAYAASIESRPQSFAMTIVGTKGTINWSWDGRKQLDLTLTNEDGEKTTPWSLTQHSEVIVHMADDFARAIENRVDWPTYLASGEDGLIAQEILEEALHQSDADKKTSVLQ